MKASTVNLSLRNAFRHTVLLLLCLIVVFPLSWAVLTSFKPTNELFSLDMFARHPTLEHYATVFSALPFARMMVNTCLMAAVVTLGVIVISVCTAYAFARWEFPGKNVLFLFFVGSLLIPAQVIIIPNYLLLAKLGWLDTLLGLTIPQFANGFGVFYLRQYFKSFPRELFDAAVLDGANSLSVLWKIVLPNTRAVLSTLAIVVFVQTWNEYFWPLLVTKSPDNTVLQVGLQLFLQEQGNAWGPLMAAATLASLPVLGLYLLAQRQITEAFIRSGIR